MQVALDLTEDEKHYLRKSAGEDCRYGTCNVADRSLKFLRFHLTVIESLMTLFWFSN